MKKTLLLILMLALAISCALTSCGDKAPESIEIVSSTFKTEYNLHETPDFSGVKAVITYNDGTTEEIGADKLTFSALDTSVAGKKTVTITFGEVSVSVDVNVKAANTGNDEETDETPTGNILMGAELPSNLAALKEKKALFRDQTQGYVVGNNNAYVLELNLTVLNENMEMVDNAPYTSVTKVYEVVNGVATLLEGDAVAAVVAIDEVNHTYDFTDAANGRTFKLEIVPNGTRGVAVEQVTCTQTVTVVDGYNIYDNKELNFITNDNWSYFGESADEVHQLTVVNKFLTANNMVRPANLNGVVLHYDVILTTNDLPPEYVIPASKSPEYAGYLYDWLMVYRRALTRENPTFSIYGNYYTIDTVNLPFVAPKSKAYNSDGISNSMLFMFNTDETLIRTREYHAALGVQPDDFKNFDPSQYTTNMYNLALRDKEPNSNNTDLDFMEQAKRGLIGIKNRWNTLNINNTRIEAFMISLLTDYDHETVNLNKVDFYNAWQCHIYASSRNYIWSKNGAENEAPAENHVRSTINITDSRLAKCGGPVIMSMTTDPEFLYNTKCGTDIFVDKASELSSFVNGTEAWFQAYGAVDAVTQVIGMSNFVSGGATAAGTTAGYVTDYNGNTAVNFIMINMLMSDGPVASTEDVDGTLKVDGTKVLDMNDGTNPELDQYLATGAPVFQTSAGGTFFTDAKTGVYELTNQGPVAPETDCYQGDYITLFVNGWGLVFKYYNATNA